MKNGSVTAGNSSSQNDAASVCLVVAVDKLDELGLEPMAYLRGWASAGVHPAYMGVGPVPAVNKLFAKTGYRWRDIDLLELNEAFASQVLSVLHQWQAPRDDIEEILNVNGSGISLGHPIAATGARILATMLHEMKRRGAKLGLETMCVGGGQGVGRTVRAGGLADERNPRHGWHARIWPRAYRGGRARLSRAVGGSGIRYGNRCGAEKAHGAREG